jgi:transcriptional regulator with XRE-family HTH domain
LSLRFAKALREMRKRRGMSQEALAEMAGLHRTYVSQLERGLKSPTLKVIERLAEALDVSLSTLMRRAEQDGNQNRN